MERFLGSNPIELLNLLNSRIAGLADKLKMGKQEMLLFIAATVAAVAIGLVGFYLARVLSMLACGSIGYIAGYELFVWAQKLHVVFFAKISVAKMPIAVGYILGAIFAVVLMILGWKKCLYVMYSMFFVAGFYFVSCCTDTFSVSLKLIVPCAAGILLAMLSAVIMKAMFILATSIAGGLATVSFLGAMLPKVAVLQLGANKNALWIGLAVAVVYAIIQFATTRHYNYAKAK